MQAVEDARKAIALDPNDETALRHSLAESKVPAMAGKLQSQMAEIEREYHGMVQQSVSRRPQPPTAAPTTNPSTA